MKYVTKDLEELNSIYGPCIIVGVFTFLTASMMLGMFDSVVLGMLTCLSIDLDLNDGPQSRGQPTFQDNISKVDEDKIREKER